MQGVVAVAAEEPVVAVAAVERIGAALAHQHVVAGGAAEHVDVVVAIDGVGKLVAGEVDGAGEDRRRRHDLDMGAGGQRVVHGREHAVERAFARRLDDDVGQAVDDVPVVAGAAGHVVLAGAAVELVVAVAAVESVVAGNAQQHVVAAAAVERVDRRHCRRWCWRARCR